MRRKLASATRRWVLCNQLPTPRAAHPQREFGERSARGTFVVGSLQASQDAPVLGSILLPGWNRYSHVRAACLLAAGMSLPAAFSLAQPPPTPASVGLQQEVVFTSYSALARTSELLRRLLSPLEAAQVSKALDSTGKPLVEQSVNLAKEHFTVYVPPQAPRAARRPGPLVWSVKVSGRALGGASGSFGCARGDWLFQCFYRCVDPFHIGVAQSDVQITKPLRMRSSFDFVSPSDAAKCTQRLLQGRLALGWIVAQ
jgi:hypothetical protein